MASEALGNRRNLHVAMVPWFAFGHMIPFYELSKAIAERGHRVTFISAPRNIDRLPKLPDNLLSSVTFLKIPLPKVDNLPENAEATKDLKAEDIQYLKIAYDGFCEKVGLFLEESKPDVVICDFAAYLVSALAKKMGILSLFFCVVSSWFLSFLGPADIHKHGEDEMKAEDLLSPPSWITFPTKVAFKHYEARWLVEGGKFNASGVSDAYRAGMVMQNSDAILLRHCNEFEHKWLKVVEDIHKKEVIPLGLMPPQIPKVTENPSWDEINNFLSTHKTRSVLYIAHGSEVMLTSEHIHELAYGLELSGVPFFWAFRKPPGSFETELPDGYEERIKGRGFVWREWVPQIKILEHESVGAFFTHSGWGSVVESLMFGKPLVLLPFIIDQCLNARVLSGNNLGLEVERNEDGSFSRNAVADAVKIVLGDEGKGIRDDAKAGSAVFGDRELHEDYYDKFIAYLQGKVGK